MVEEAAMRVLTVIHGLMGPNRGDPYFKDSVLSTFPEAVSYLLPCLADNVDVSLFN